MQLISDAVEAGNIAVIADDDPADIRLCIRPDAGPGARQWFHFRAEPVAVPHRLRIVDAGATTYPEGWRHHRVCASTDGETWRRIATRFDGDVLEFDHPAGGGDRPTLYALSVPYGSARLARLAAACRAAPAGQVSTVTNSVGGDDVLCLSIGAGRRVAWVVARQHPGEMPASWFAEGLLERLLDPADPTARRLVRDWTFRVVPLANPDGHRLGQQRCNAAGLDLNRQWSDPDRDGAPEVAGIRDAMLRTGVDLCLDVHAGAVLPYVYVDEVGAFVGTPSDRVSLRQRFEAALAAASPDFQTERRYPWSETPARAEVRRMCAPWAADTFGALGLTLELPLSDYDRRPDPAEGWSARRSKTLGAACLDAIAATG